MSFPKPVTRGTFAAGENAGAALYSVGHLRFNLVSLCGCVKRPNNHTLLHTVSHTKLFNFTDELRYKLVVDLREKVKPLDGEARLTAVEEAADRRRADSFVEVGVVADDHGVASTKF